MNRIAAAALTTLLLPLWTLACRDGDPTGVVANQDTVADAGGNLTRIDVDGDGLEQIALDGSRSRDADGSITDFAWLEMGNLLADGVVPNVSFDLGPHDVTLIVTDDRGATDADFVRIVVEPSDALDPPTNPGGNSPPTARITGPCNSLRIYEGRGMYFDGQGLDAEEGRLPNESFEWTYDGRPVPRCGDGDWNGLVSACGDGGWIESIELGSHVLTLSVTDSEGAQGSASITMTGVEFSDASFTDDILSFMLYACESCHGAERQEGGIRLDSYEAITTGENANGPLIVRGDPTGGILIPKVLSDHLVVDGYGLHMSQWMGETILPVWILEGARNTDHEHPPWPEPRCGGLSTS